MNRNRKSRRNKFLDALPLVSLLLIIWEMSIFRKTFIDIRIPITILMAGGLCAFLFAKKRMPYYRESRLPLFFQGLFGAFIFGGIILFCFMAFNYYLPIGKGKQISLSVMKTGHFGGRTGHDPYVIVMYGNLRKQVVFSSGSNVENCISINVRIKRGLFGFDIIENAELGNYSPDKEEIKQYNKIERKAEEYYSKGNIDKAIELYERAVRLKPTDSLVRKRLEELRAISVN